MKFYYSFDKLKSDLPYIKDVKIKVANDFDKTINLDTFHYKSFLAQLKRQNIKIEIDNSYEKKKA